MWNSTLEHSSQPHLPRKLRGHAPSVAEPLFPFGDKAFGRADGSEVPSRELKGHMPVVTPRPCCMQCGLSKQMLRNTCIAFQ